MTITAKNRAGAPRGVGALREAPLESTKRSRLGILPGSLMLKLGGFGVLAVLLLVIVPQLWVYTRYRGLIYDDLAKVPSAPVAIVFGAGLRPDGLPSDMLADRVETGVALYKAGKVQRLLMSGDNGSSDYDEVSAMKRLAIAKGVPADRVVLDHAGFRTYDSSFRAKAIFGITEAILVSQGYHLPRALYFANSFGVKAVGLKAGRDYYPGQTYYDLREAASLAIAWYEVNIVRHNPRYLGDPIDLNSLSS